MVVSRGAFNSSRRLALAVAALVTRLVGLGEWGNGELMPVVDEGRWPLVRRGGGVGLVAGSIVEVGTV